MSQTAPTEKRPRHYAAEIIALKSSEGRASARARVPAVFRAWVDDLVEDYHWRRSQPPAAGVGCAPRTNSAGHAALAGLKEALA
jgi:hypothetical protein